MTHSFSMPFLFHVSLSQPLLVLSLLVLHFTTFCSRILLLIFLVSLLFFSYAKSREPSIVSVIRLVCESRISKEEFTLEIAFPKSTAFFDVFAI